MKFEIKSGVHMGRSDAKEDGVIFKYRRRKSYVLSKVWCKFTG